VPPLDALTGEHEEEDGCDHHANAQLPPQQHGWTDGERGGVSLLPSRQSNLQPAMSACFGAVCRHLDILSRSAVSPLSFISAKPRCAPIGGDGGSPLASGSGGKKRRHQRRGQEVETEFV